eukprot:TRINITY_DN106024_c0_g1_i1.p2 TRINITY_DN106024_c0_g1~~TRINITY_DN106024_c0_g1_i1.p2  ORF type:complete len:114 (-),score=36.25 TRINITY_DN106024_c0_g1_i1:10-351(-)
MDIFRVRSAQEAKDKAKRRGKRQREKVKEKGKDEEEKPDFITVNGIGCLDEFEVQIPLRTQHRITAFAFSPSSGTKVEKKQKNKQLTDSLVVAEIGRAVQQECRDRSRMPSSA